MQPESASQVRRLVENLEKFDFAPGVQNAEDGQFVNSGDVAYGHTLELQAQTSDLELTWGL